MARPAASDPPRAKIILDAAHTAFLRDGFSGTSIDGIAATTGVSKATIYRHYSGKQALLEAVINRAVQDSPVSLAFDSLDDLTLSEALNKFAKTMLSSLSSEDVVDLFRLVVAESKQNPGLGVNFFAAITSVAAIPLAGYLQQVEKSGQISVKNAQLMAFQFIGMIKEPLFWPRLMGVKKESLPFSEAKVIKTAVERFVLMLKPTPAALSDR